MTWDELRFRYPELQPINGMPALFNIYGCGLLMYGARDEDPELSTFVKTRYLCVFGIPLLALGSYRVAATSEGMMILGREPISTPMVWLNIIVLLAGLGGGATYGVHSLLTSDSYIAKRKIDEADRLFEAGKVGEALPLYEAVAVGATESAPVALERISRQVDQPDGRLKPADVAAVYRSAAQLSQAGRWPKGPAGLYDSAMARANQQAATDPRAAVMLLEVVSPIAPKGDDPTALMRQLLERIVAETPGDVEMVSRLAVLLEGKGEKGRCVTLLEPLRKRLGDSEGARVLGQIDAREGKIEEATSLLRPYVRSRLDRLRAAEERLKELIKTARDTAVEELKSGTAPGFDYRKAKAVGGDKAQEMAWAYVNAKLQADPAIAHAERAFEAQAGLASVALDLGMLLLQRAQGLTDPEARKAELAEAESTLLAISRLAGESPEFQLSLGQVYYWEGKSKEGRAEFDKLLKARDRDPRLLLQIASLLREVGSMAEASTLAEETYTRASEPALKQNAAMLRGLVETDPDKRLTWLERGGGEGFQRAIILSEKAYKQLSEGAEDEAIRSLKESIGLYEGLPDQAGKLNNLASNLNTLALLTGDEEMDRRALAMIDRALLLEPGNSLTLSNASRFHLDAAVRDIIGGSLDLKILKLPADIHMLSHLYDDQAGRDAFAKKVAAHPGVARAMSLEQKLILLSPRNPHTYESAFSIANFLHDRAKLEGVLAKIAGADLDLSRELKDAEERKSGANEQTRRSMYVSYASKFAGIASQARSHGRDATLAYALDHLAQIRLHLHSLGEEVDLDGVVALAEEADAASASEGTRSTLISALLSRADDRLAASNPGYAEVREKTRRTLEASYRMAAALSGDGPLAQAAASLPDAIRAADIQKLDFEKLPRGGGTFSWATLRKFHPEAAAAAAKAYLAEDSNRAARQIREALDPYSNSVALRNYWFLAMTGRDAEASNYLRACESKQVILPVERKP